MHSFGNRFVCDDLVLEWQRHPCLPSFDGLRYHITGRCVTAQPRLWYHSDAGAVARPGLLSLVPCVVIARTMTREQYEQRKRRLEEQLRAGIQLLESAYQAQVRALDLVWMLQAEELAAGPVVEAADLSSPEPAPMPPPAKQEVAPPPSRPPRPGTAEVERDLRAALPRLPESFTRGDVCVALGYEPDRSTLYRLLRELVQKGSIRVESVGSGRKATIYRRTA